MSASIDLQTEDLRLLDRCVRDGSLSAAARALGITQAAASRRLHRLEADVGGPVLHRTTRALRPTALGERVLALARTFVAELDALERAATDARVEATGTVRVSAPVLLGQALGAALALDLAQRHPGLLLDLSLGNARVDLVRDDIDLALRVGRLPDATLKATRLATARIGAYVAPDGRPEPTSPEALLDRRWIGLPGETLLRATGPAGARWEGEVTLAFRCDDRLVLRAAAVAGLGAVLLPTFLGDDTPGLVRLLPEWRFGEVPLHGVWLPESRADPRVRAVLDGVGRWIRSRPDGWVPAGDG
jgi:DNA-binding transcriptional LysR family regulator